MRGFCGCVELGNSVPFPLLENSFCVNCTGDGEKLRKGMMILLDSFHYPCTKECLYEYRSSSINAGKVELNEMCQIARQR